MGGERWQKNSHSVIFGREWTGKEKGKGESQPVTPRANQIKRVIKDSAIYHSFDLAEGR